MTTYELPNEAAAFMSHEDWNFAVTCSGCPVSINLQELGFPTEREELSFLKRTSLSIASKIVEAISRAADEFHEEYNGRWNPCASISRESFIARLVPTAIHIMDLRFYTLELATDGELFDGHLIEAHFDQTFQITSVTLEG